MKPRTKTEKEVIRLSKKMGSIGVRDTKKLLDNTYGSCAYDDMYDRCYAVINQSYQGWQVLRYFRITRKGKRNISYTTWEVMQLWNKQGEKQIVVSRKRTMGWYLDTFVLSSDLEVRKQGGWLDIPYAYLYNKSLCGIFADVEPSFSDDLYNVNGTFINRRKMYSFLSKTDYPETFIKAYPCLFADVHAYGYGSDPNFATALKIVNRHHYVVQDGISYMDYLKALIYLGKDIHNPFYVCPANFEEMHDKYIDKYMDAKAKAEAKRKAETMKEDAERYFTWRKRFFDMVIGNGQIECKVLRSIADFYKEGEAMHNCVYKMGYYKKPYSLIFSARIEGKRVETVEFDLNDNKVIQAYGKCNKFSKHHDEIVKLVNSYASMIQMYNRRKNNEQIKKIAV